MQCWMSSDEEAGMKITLVVNTNKQESGNYAALIQQYLEARGVQVQALYSEQYARDDFEDADAIITIGGDGTMLRLAGVLRG